MQNNSHEKNNGTPADHVETMNEVIMPETQEAEKSQKNQVGESVEEKAKQYWDQLLRLQAEFANYRKRTEKEKTEAIRFGKELIIEKMVSLADVMDQALKHSENATDIQSLKTGFQMVAVEFLKFLKFEGVEPLKTVGESFDPHIHEAVEQVETEKEEENNKVLEELQKGYTVDGRLLRPAKVKVAKKKNQKENGKNES